MSTESQPAGATDGDRERPYVVLKRGFFWRPNDQGYTSSINDAARYTEAEAKERCHGGEEPVTMALAVEYQVTDADMELATALSTYPEKRIEYARRIARHLAARLAPVEAERDALFKINGDLARLLDVEKQAESERDALRATVAKMGEALEPLTRMTALVLKLKEALEAAQGFANRAGYFLGGIDPVLALVPADLADCCVLRKDALPSLAKFQDLTQATAALEAENRALREAADSLATALSYCVTSGPLNSGLKDENTLNHARTTLKKLGYKIT